MKNFDKKKTRRIFISFLKFFNFYFFFLFFDFLIF